MKFKANWRAMSAMQLIFVILFAVIALGAAVWWLVVHDAGRRQQGIEAAIDQERLAGPKPLIPAPQTFMPLTAEEAAEANEEMPFSRESVEPAPALVLPIGPGEGERQGWGWGWGWAEGSGSGSGWVGVGLRARARASRATPILATPTRALPSETGWV